MMCAAMCAVAGDAVLTTLHGSRQPEALRGASLRSWGQTFPSPSWSARTWTSLQKKRLEPLVLAAVIPSASMGSTPISGRGTLKERLRNGEQLYGAFSVSFSPVVAEILGWSGYDFVVVDLEHGPGDTMAAIPMLQALTSTGTPAIIRIPVNDRVWVKKALDMGPAGIMFPMVDDADAAREAVISCRYPPEGVRGAAYPIVRASRYGLDPSYLSRCEDDLLIMCQLESQQAVNNIVNIAAVEGVDCIQVGPMDLRADLGLLRDLDNKMPTAFLREVEKTLKSSGVYLAGFATSDDPPSKLLKLGYHMVSGAIDVALLRDAAVADIRNARAE